MVPIPAMVTAQRPLQPTSWNLQPHYEARHDFVSAQEVLQGRFPGCMPRNLVQEHDFCLEIPTSNQPELPELDFGQWQCDANVSLLTPVLSPMTLIPSLATPSGLQRKRIISWGVLPRTKRRS
jgi:hypothetical protein